MEVDFSANSGAFPTMADVTDVLSDSEDALSLNFSWSVEQEILLFEAMVGHKPVGVDKNIHMMCIFRKLSSKWKPVPRAIKPQHIWAKLSSMYDLEALDESECLPFPDKKEDFALPLDDFGPLMTSFPAETSSRSANLDQEEVDDDLETPDKEEAPEEETAPSAPTLDTDPPSIAQPPAPPSTPAAATSTPTPATPTPSTSTPTTSKPGRKRSKATNQGEGDKTPSGPSSAKRSRR